jgi:hypothetical protein
MFSGDERSSQLPFSILYAFEVGHIAHTINRNLMLELISGEWSLRCLGIFELGVQIFIDNNLFESEIRARENIIC